MYMFLVEWLFVLGMLIGYGVIGGFLVVPFRQALPFGFLAAPFAGLLLMAFGSAFSYNVLGLPLLIGFLVTGVLGLAGTVWILRRAGVRVRWRPLIVPLVATLLLAGAVTAITVSTSIMLGHPGIQYSHSTDHLGYAHLADWITAHPPSERPRANPAVPYESWPALLFDIDPRMGAFSTLALIAKIRGLSGTFSYDLASAVVLTTVMLGIAGVFARSRLSLILLLLGLLTSHWYDYSRTGYFAKILGFPARGIA